MGLGVLAVASHVERKSNLERKSEQRGDPLLVRIAIAMMLAVWLEWGDLAVGG
jgi:hypothetical protein